MPGEDIYSWSVTAVNNGNADSAIEWREGQTRASVNNSARSEMAAHAKDRNLKNGSITTTNTANAYAFTSGVTYTTVPTGLRVKLKIGTTTNTGSSTLNMDGIGDVTIKDDQGVALRGGELVANGYTDFLYDGTNWIFLYSHAFFIELITGGDGIIIATQVFKVPGVFTYTPSSPLVQCAIVECVGGGGGGGAGLSTLANTFFQGGGGGGGGYSRKSVNLAQIGVSQTVTVGLGGMGSQTDAPGGTGGVTSFGTLCIANGGGGGTIGRYETNPDAGAGAAAGTGDIAVAGSPGHFGWFSRSSIDTYTMGGNGAPGPFGGGAVSPTLTAGVNATGYGAGGSGGSNYAAAGGNWGGAGSGGLVIITEFGGRGAAGRDGVDGEPGPTGPMGSPGPAGAGTGDVLVSGTPAPGQMAQWTDNSHIRGIDVVANSPPTRQVKTSGSGTYTTPANVRWLEVELIGGGGGGAAGGGAGVGTAGSATTFGSMIGSAGGGAGASGSPFGGIGGTATGGDINIVGGRGMGNANAGDSNVFSAGGEGASTLFAGGGAAGYGIAGYAGSANSGTGGGGGGTSVTTITLGGAGGGAGGYVRKLIAPPDATYSYAVGAGGTGAAPGGAGFGGGAGGSGIIIITEYY